MAPDPSNYDRIPLGLVVVLAVFLAVGLAASQFIQRPEEPAVTLPDLSTAHFVEIRNVSGRTVLSGEFRERPDPLGSLTREAALADRPGHHVVGEIEINIPGPGAMSLAQELEIDIIEMRPNTRYLLVIDDRELTTFTTDDRGSVDTVVRGP